MSQLNEWMNQREKNFGFHCFQYWVIYDCWNLECQQICKMFSRADSLLIRIVDLDDFILVALTIRGWRPWKFSTITVSPFADPTVESLIYFKAFSLCLMKVRLWTTLLSRSGLIVCMGTGCWLSRRSVTWRHNLELEEGSMMFLYKPSNKDGRSSLLILRTVPRTPLFYRLYQEKAV